MTATQRRASVSLFVVLLATSGIVRPAAAQAVKSQPQNPYAQPAATAPAESGVAAPSSVDVSKLPLNLNRLERRLRTSETREQRNGLNLSYAITVYGQAPRIRLFTPADNLAFGRAPYGAPTHSEMLWMMTPKEHRGQTADFGAAIRWLADKAK